ncbi:hypothetical protein NSMM_960003 [Nitrosomonas mobilis]|uniref:ISXO2-like transposase domain-containing protein n=1 Tax=Nitrosomonas mobilis TaxID=51642 RepID=A0A1G5SJ60_9PROT|nr:transposase [Nitrosomonas mobilis]SCZ87178.1 hypothetical protein NSMM_960003 [Nitrosomonas mobilis]
MLLREEERRLDGRVEVDDAYLGGARSEKCGRGAASKTPFVATIQTNSEGKPLYIRLTPIADFTYEALKQWSAECLSSTLWEVANLLCSMPSFDCCAPPQRQNLFRSVY